MSTYRNNVAMTVSGTPGTGTITLNAAVTGAQSFASAYGSSGTSTIDIDIRDGTSVWVVTLTSAAVVRVAATAATIQELDDFGSALGALSGTVSVTGTATATISRLHVCSGTTADYTVTLPAVSGNSGKYIGFVM